MIIGYARVSTQDQNTELQIDALKRANCECIYEEKITGSTRHRPEFETYLNILRERDTLLAWQLDKLGPSPKDLVEIVTSLEGRGVSFRSLTENIDTSSTGGKVTFYIFGALAEFERNLISDRTKAGLAAARARGRKGGRKPKMTANDVKLANAMLSDPATTKTEVAKHFGVSRVTLNASLKRYSE